MQKYANFQDFRQDFEVAQNAAAAVHGSNNQTKAVDPSIAWDLYKNSKVPSLGFHTFGRHITGDKARDLMQFRATHGKTAQLPPNLVGMNYMENYFKNFGTVNNQNDKLGSILLMGGGSWNFTVNDAWLIGGVHAKLDFYPASIVHRGNVLDNRYWLTITGRELLGLAIFGYRQAFGHPSIGHVYICDDTNKAEAASLPAYQLAVSKIKSMQDASRLFGEKAFQIL